MRQSNLLQKNDVNTVIEERLPTELGSLQYRLSIPKLHGIDQLAPLIVMLHGCKQDARDFSVGTQMDRIATKAGCFVVYPQQSYFANLSACWNWFKPTHQERERGEPKALANLISKLIQTYAVDASRVYVAGLSAGGAMAAIMGDQYPDLFAAVGIHSGIPAGVAGNFPEALQIMRGYYSETEKHKLALPTIVFHGDADKTVSPANAQYFAQAMLSNPATRVETIKGIAGRPFTRNIYRSENGNLVGEQWKIKGAGHAWSGGSKDGTFADACGPNASAEMMRFFFEISNERNRQLPLGIQKAISSYSL